MQFLATAVLVNLLGSVLPGPTAPAVTPEPVYPTPQPMFELPMYELDDPAGYRGYSTGIDIWEVWICELPHGSAHVTAAEASQVLSAELVPYFDRLSEGHYQPASPRSARHRSTTPTIVTPAKSTSSSTPREPPTAPSSSPTN